MEQTKEALAELMAPEKESAKEVFPGMTVEEIRAVFFNSDALREPEYRIYQLNTDGHRYYYRFEDGTPVFYPSVTTLLKQVMPTPPALLDWMLSNGKDGATEKRDLAAAYGTLMHTQFELLIINRRYDFDSVPSVVLSYMERENLPEKVFSEWCVKLRKDVLAFAQAVKDYNVKPLAVEIGLVHPVNHYAGCIDLPCIMTDPKTGEIFPAIWDFKSGRKGFFEEHELQLHLYREMWNVNFPDVQITRVFNFSPKDWRTKPTYNLKEQTGSVNAAKLPYLLALATIEDEKRDNTLTVVRGTLDLDNGKISDNVLTLSLAELIKAKTEKENAPEQAAAVPEATETVEIPVKAAEKPVKRMKSKKQGITPAEPEKDVKTEIDEKLPWEKDMKDGTGIEVAKMVAGLKVKATYHEPIQDKKPVNVDSEIKAIETLEQVARENLLNFEKAQRKQDTPIAPAPAHEPEPEKPAGPTPEQLAEQTKQAEKENLLNFEMEL